MPRNWQGVPRKRLHLIEGQAEVERIRKALLEYCRLDTLAMVRVLVKLREVAGK